MNTAKGKIEDNINAAGHAVQEKKHDAEAFANKAERQNPNVPIADRASAAISEAGHNIASTYHAAAKNVDKS
jgi:hypothetical protein